MLRSGSYAALFVCVAINLLFCYNFLALLRELHT